MTALSGQISQPTLSKGMEDIVAYRLLNGAFTNLDQLSSVHGVGGGLIGKWEGLLFCGRARSRSPRRVDSSVRVMVHRPRPAPIGVRAQKWPKTVIFQVFWPFRAFPSTV